MTTEKFHHPSQNATDLLALMEEEGYWVEAELRRLAMNIISPGCEDYRVGL